MEFQTQRRTASAHEDEKAEDGMACNKFRARAFRKIRTGEPPRELEQRAGRATKTRRSGTRLERSSAVHGKREVEEQLDCLFAFRSVVDLDFAFGRLTTYAQSIKNLPQVRNDKQRAVIFQMSSLRRPLSGSQNQRSAVSG